MMIPPDDLVNGVCWFFGIVFAIVSTGLLVWFWRKLRQEAEAERIRAMRKDER